MLPVNPWLPHLKGFLTDIKDAFKRAWKTALRRSGIAKCRFHDLRHTFTSNLIVKEKEDLITVSELTGHKDIRMLKRYGHTREEFKKEAIRKLGEGLKLAQNSSNNPTTITQGKNKVKIVNNVSTLKT